MATPTKPINLGLLFGGRSCEHEISVTSARSILRAINRHKYNISLLGIDKAGQWHLADDFDSLLSDGAVQPAAAGKLPRGGGGVEPVTLALHPNGNLRTLRDSPPLPHHQLPQLEVIFPALHGTFGEDGALQGVLEMAGIPYVGCGVAASAVAMDKLLAKKIFQLAGIPQAAYIGLSASQWQHTGADAAARAALMARGEAELGYPMFVKPANLGSSVGISKVRAPAQLKNAIELALRFDHKILLEQAMENCVEAECAVLGNAMLGAQQQQRPQASVVGEIIPHAEFYDYAAKYLDDQSELVVPANIPRAAAAQVRELSLAAFQEIDGAGLARVDFFVSRASGRVTLNEINTMPGFTPISMYPRLWAASGVPYAELIDRLIELAVQTQRAKAALQRSV